MSYHIDLSIPIRENVFRLGSEAYFDLFVQARHALNEGSIELDEIDRAIIEETDIGRWAFYEDQEVPLDCPFMESNDDKPLNKPQRGGNKKYYVYVKNDKGNVVKVEFGQPGMDVRFDNEKARASFAARHQCSSKKDRTKPGYWSCNLPRYAKQLGLSGGGDFFW